MSFPEPSLHFVRFTSAHLPYLIIIENDSYPDPWTPGMFNQEVVNPASHFHVAMLDTEVIGYGGFWLQADEAHITKLTVASPFRRRGFGTHIMLHLLREAVRINATVMRLEVRESNAAARTLYERLGFSAIGVRRGYYSRLPENAVVMEKWLREKDHHGVQGEETNG